MTLEMVADQILQHSAPSILCKNPLQGQADHLLKLVFKKKTFKICIQSNTFQCYIYISLHFLLIPSHAAFPFPSRYPPAKLSVLLFSYLISMINKSFGSFWFKKEGVILCIAECTSLYSQFSDPAKITVNYLSS